MHPSWVTSRDLGPSIVETEAAAAAAMIGDGEGHPNIMVPNMVLARPPFMPLQPPAGGFRMPPTSMMQMHMNMQMQSPYMNGPAPVHHGAPRRAVKIEPVPAGVHHGAPRRAVNRRANPLEITGENPLLGGPSSNTSSALTWTGVPPLWAEGVAAESQTTHGHPPHGHLPLSTEVESSSNQKNNNGYGHDGDHTRESSNPSFVVPQRSETHSISSEQGQVCGVPRLGQQDEGENKKGKNLYSMFSLAKTNIRSSDSENSKRKRGTSRDGENSKRKRDTSRDGENSKRTRGRSRDERCKRTRSRSRDEKSKRTRSRSRDGKDKGTRSRSGPGNPLVKGKRPLVREQRPLVKKETARSSPRDLDPIGKMPQKPIEPIGKMSQKPLNQTGERSGCAGEAKIPFVAPSTTGGRLPRSKAIIPGIPIKSVRGLLAEKSKRGLHLALDRPVAKARGNKPSEAYTTQQPQAGAREGASKDLDVSGEALFNIKGQSIKFTKMATLRSTAGKVESTVTPSEQLGHVTSKALPPHPRRWDSAPHADTIDTFHAEVKEEHQSEEEEGSAAAAPPELAAAVTAEQAAIGAKEEPLSSAAWEALEQLKINLKILSKELKDPIGRGLLKKTARYVDFAFTNPSEQSPEIYQGMRVKAMLTSRSSVALYFKVKNLDTSKQGIVSRLDSMRQFQDLELGGICDVYVAAWNPQGKEVYLERHAIPQASDMKRVDHGH